MRMEAADTGLVTDSIEGAAHIDGVLGTAQFGAKDKVVILIGGSGLCFVLLLLFENIHQQLNRRLMERDSPLTGWGLGSAKGQVPAFIRLVGVFHLTKRPLNV